MPETMLNRYTYPEWDAKPYWDVIKSFYGELDVAVYQAKNRDHAFLCGGGSLTWNPLTFTFAWTDDFKIPLVMSGFVTSVEYGPNGTSRSAAIQSGECLYCVLPTQVTANVTRNAAVASTLSNTDSNFVIAYNCDNILYVRNGQILT